MRLTTVAIALGLLAVGVVGSQLRAADTAAGKATFERVCAKCHGNPTEGADGPALVPMYLTLADVMTVVRGGQAKMPAIPETTVSDQDIAAIVDYLNSLGQ